MLYSICRRTVKQRLLPFEFETEPYREYGENILEEKTCGKPSAPYQPVSEISDYVRTNKQKKYGARDKSEPKNFSLFCRKTKQHFRKKYFGGVLSEKI